MLSLSEIKNRLSDRNLKEVSRRTDLSYQTIINVVNSDDSDCTCEYRTIAKISAYLEGENNANWKTMHGSRMFKACNERVSIL